MLLPKQIRTEEVPDQEESEVVQGQVSLVAIPVEGVVEGAVIAVIKEAGTLRSGNQVLTVNQAEAWVWQEAVGPAGTRPDPGPPVEEHPWRCLTFRPWVCPVIKVGRHRVTIQWQEWEP